ncbi:MAG: hypothetical protein AAF721_16715 [Myxococcota bacterium]
MASGLGLALSLGLGTTLACGGEFGRDVGPGDGLGGDKADEPTVTAIEEGLDRPLSDAVAHARNEANWILPGPRPASGDDGDAGDPGPGDDGAGSGTCAGKCGGPGSDDTCYCDSECTGNGDCCTDYSQHCSDGGDGDGDGGGDGGGEAGDDGAGATCVGRCGAAGSDNSCYCDSECTANGDCCSDYASACPNGGADGGDGGGDGGGGGETATCNGFCGGAGADASCYCDDSCVEAGDCCADYDATCGVGINAPSSVPELAPPRAVNAASSACWGIITDPIDVDRVGRTAGAAGLLFGGSCVVVLAVPAGAGAAPTGGLSVGAAALACGSATIGGAALGAVVDLTSQKMGSIVQCSSDVLAEAVRLFPWGRGEKVVPVPTYGTPPPADPGNCNKDQHRGLQDDVNSKCKGSGQRSCVASNTCEAIAAKVQLAAECIAARSKINSQCYDGGDKGHNEAIQNEVNLQGKCQTFGAQLGC